MKRLLGLLLTLPALTGFAAAPVLRTVGELDDYMNGPAQPARSYAVTGTVTSVGLFPLTNGTHDLILSDGPRRVYVFNASFQPPPAGTVAAIAGIAYFPSNREPWMICRTVDAVGKGRVDDIPTIPLSHLDMRESALREIVVEADVAGVLQDEVDSGFSFLILKDGGATLPVACRTSKRPQHLEDARIRVRGILLRHPTGQRKHLGHCLLARDIRDITVIAEPPSDPFDFPPLPARLYMSPKEVSELGKRSARGHVIASWQRNRLYVSADDGRTFGVELAEDEVPPPYGASVTVVGHPETDLYRINLTGARIRTDAGKPFVDDEPVATTTAALLSGGDENADFSDTVRGKLVRLSGIVRSLPSEDSADRRLLLDCGPLRIPVDYSSNPTAANGLTIGCTVEVTGRCLLETEKWTPTRIFPRINGLTLVLRRPDDLRILSRPSWWTPQRLMIVIAGLFATLLGLFVWNRILNRLVRRKSRALLKEEVAHLTSELKIGERTRLAVELHDSISQTLAGIAYQLTSSASAIDESAETAKQRIRTAEQMLKSCRTELRHCLYDLRGDMLEEPDFAVAIRKTLAQLEGDADIVMRVSVKRSLLHDSSAHAILSIIRELVANALHHGQARTVRIAGCVDGGRLLFSVRDDGVGFDPTRCKGPREGHFGIVGIRDRLRKLNGTLSFSSPPDGGTKASVDIPLSLDPNPTEDMKI